MADILQRWARMLRLLRNQLGDNGFNEVPDDVLDQTRERIRRFAQDVDQRVVQLPPPGKDIADDPAFEGMQWGHPGPAGPLSSNEVWSGTPPAILNAVNLPTLTDPVQMARTIMELERLLTITRRQADEYRLALDSLRKKQGRMLVAQAGGREYVPQPRFAKRRTWEPPPCACGCGQVTKLQTAAGGRPIRLNRYLLGHVRQYTRYVIAVESGAMRWVDLPEMLKTKLNWVRCDLCEGQIPDTDPMGRKIDEKVGLWCWRVKRRVSWPYKSERVVRGGK